MMKCFYYFSSSSDTNPNKEYIGIPEEVNSDEANNEEDEVPVKEPSPMIPCLYCSKLCKSDQGIKRHEKYCDAKKPLNI